MGSFDVEDGKAFTCWFPVSLALEEDMDVEY